ncbi:MAG: glycosyltransferase family 2 protein [Cyanobacteria bacterium J06623_7]
MSNLFFVIVNYYSSELIDRLLQSLTVDYQLKFQAVIVNNSLDDVFIGNLSSEGIHVIEAPENLGFGRACNLGLDWIFSQDPQAIVWLINPDTYFPSEANLAIESPPQKAIALFQQYPQLSIVGTTVYDPAGQLIDAGGKFQPGTAAITIVNTFPSDCTAEYLPVDWVSGCSLLLNLANFATCPHFDPRYFLYYEDLDFCLRYGQQHQIVIAPQIRVIHETSSITDRNLGIKYRHITHSYLIHIEKHGNLPTFIITNLRMAVNTLRLLVFRPQQGRGKLKGMYHYWHTRFIKIQN